MVLPKDADPGQTLRAVEYLEGHVNCRCTLVPRPKSYAELTGDPSIPDTRPPIQTGPEAFAKLPAATQRAILGPGKHALYEAGVPLDAMWQTHSSAEWGRSRVGKPLYALQAEVDAGMHSGGGGLTAEPSAAEPM